MKKYQQPDIITISLRSVETILSDADESVDDGFVPGFSDVIEDWD